jgi:hypothetical protein
MISYRGGTGTVSYRDVTVHINVNIKHQLEKILLYFLLSSFFFLLLLFYYSTIFK